MAYQLIQLFYLSSVIINCLAIATPARKRDTKESVECGLKGQPPCSINFQIPSPYLSSKDPNGSLNNFQIFQAPVSFNLYFDGKNRSKPGLPKIEIDLTQKSSRKSMEPEKNSGIPAAVSDIKSGGVTSDESDKLPNSYVEMYAQLISLVEAEKEIKRKIDTIRRKITSENIKIPENPNSVLQKRFASHFNAASAKGTTLKSHRDGNQQQQRYHSKKIKS